MRGAAGRALAAAIQAGEVAGNARSDFIASREGV